MNWLIGVRTMQKKMQVKKGSFELEPFYHLAYYTFRSLLHPCLEQTLFMKSVSGSTWVSHRFWGLLSTCHPPRFNYDYMTIIYCHSIIRCCLHTHIEGMFTASAFQPAPGLGAHWLRPCRNQKKDGVIECVSWYNRLIQKGRHCCIKGAQ